MEDKNKPVDVTTTQQASAAEKKADGTVVVQSKGDEGLDYKAELEKTKKELDQAQFTIVGLKKKKKDESTEIPVIDVNAGDEDEDDVEDDRINQIVSKKVQESTEKFKSELLEDVIGEEISKITVDPAKQELIRLNYDKRIVKTGYKRSNIQDDIQAALAITDRKRLEKQVSEMKQTVSSNQAKNTSGSAAGQPTESALVNISDTEKAWVKNTAKSMGISEEVVMKKLLSNKAQLSK